MIERYDVNEEWAHSGIIKAGDFCFLNYCVGNVGGSIEQQVNGELLYDNAFGLESYIIVQKALHSSSLRICSVYL